jgi:ABC-type uncharacterized transport system fused permease/ATPase subunit
VQLVDQRCHAHARAGFNSGETATVRRKFSLRAQGHRLLHLQATIKLQEDLCPDAMPPGECPGQGITCRVCAGVAAAAVDAPAGLESLITVQDVSKSHDGMRVLFSDLTFTLSRGDRMAIIGANGSGAPSS